MPGITGLSCLAHLVTVEVFSAKNISIASESLESLLLTGSLPPLEFCSLVHVT